MKLCLPQLKIELQEIRDHIAFLDSLKSEINPANDSYKYLSSSSRKRYDYNSIIISLYGVLESYVRKFISEYLDIVENSIFEYEILSEHFRAFHFQKSLNLISKVIENKYQQYSHLTKESILDNLNKCILKAKPFTINKEAFFINTGNLKHTKTCEVFRGIDINLDADIRLYDGFKLSSENLFNRQDELVERRNEIAHGAVTQIMDNSEVVPLIEYLEVFFEAINNLLSDKAETDVNSFKKNKFSSQIDKFNVYKGNIIGILGGAKLNLKIDSEIFVERASDKVILAQIIDIKSFTGSDDITIKIDKNIRENCRFHIFNTQSYESERPPKT